jgi:calcineurin-like phosphoesterase family protein
MTKDIWFISDTHFGHEACCTKFKRRDGSPLRPFANADEMDEVMIERWNERVKPHDKVYHLGDVVINKKFLPLLARLNGKKKLIRGNHDIYQDHMYREYFESIYGVRVYVDKFIMSHIPLHPDSITKRFKVNVHGHYHANRVLNFVGGGNGVLPSAEYSDDAIPYGPDHYLFPNQFCSDYNLDERYVSVCVEHTNYAPVHLDELEEAIKNGGNFIR